MDRTRLDRGVSLTELVTVLAIMAVLVVMAGPSYQATIARAQARGVASVVASELRMARQLAMARRERLLVQFDRSLQTITLRRAESGEVLDVYRYADRGAVIEEPSGGPDVLFHPSGRSATATSIMILDARGKKTTISVSLTGRVTIS